MASAPVARQFYPKFRPQKGCLRNGKRRPEIGGVALASCFSRPAFLNQPHPPKTGRPASELACYKKVEQEFSASLNNLCILYGLRVPKLVGLFPMNIQKAHASLSAALEEKDRDLQLRIMQDENGRVSLATIKTFNTKTTLYYLPLDNVWELMKKKDRKSESDLLLSMLAYLYQIAGVPHFCENYSYLGEIYEMVADWQEEQKDKQPEEDQNYRKHLEQHYSLLYSAGGIMLSLLADSKNLGRFSGRVRRFRPKDEKGEGLQACARGLLKLYRRFPRRSITDNMGLIEENTEENTVRADQYISFYWSNNDCIIDNVMEYVNCELNELSQMEEPQSIQYFDAPQARENHDFSFEQTFFGLLNDLTDILNDLK